MNNSQYQINTHTGKSFFIDGNDGHSQEVDRSGFNIKSYHTGLTGTVGAQERTSTAKLLGDRVMMPKVDPYV